MTTAREHTERTPMTDTTPPDEAPDFAAFLLTLAKGRTHRELSEALRALTGAVIETGKPGTLTLTLGIKRQPNTDSFVVTDKVTVKAPAFDRPASIFFADDAHNLVRNPANQHTLFEESK